MRKVPLSPRALASSLSISLLFLLAAAAPARAEAATAPPGSFVFGSGNGSGGAGLGVGAAAFLGGMTGVEVVYDQPRWHLEGLLGFNSRDVNNGPNPPVRTEFTFGVRAWYHLHQGSNSDFSIGGGVGFDHVSVSNNGGAGTQTFLEPGVQARIFLSPNFALFGLAGFTLDFGDNVGGVNSGVALGGQVTAGFGFTYFFR